MKTTLFSTGILIISLGLVGCSKLIEAPNIDHSLSIKKENINPPLKISLLTSDLTKKLEKKDFYLDYGKMAGLFVIQKEDNIIDEKKYSLLKISKNKDLIKLETVEILDNENINRDSNKTGDFGWGDLAEPKRYALLVDKCGNMKSNLSEYPDLKDIFAQNKKSIDELKRDSLFRLLHPKNIMCTTIKTDNDNSKIVPAYGELKIIYKGITKLDEKEFAYFEIEGSVLGQFKQGEDRFNSNKESIKEELVDCSIKGKRIIATDMTFSQDELVMDCGGGKKAIRDITYKVEK